ncbi:MAG TPA: hypothetical protein VIJ14_09325 [Rhabdochlamydiaceae bacterium]
MASKTSLDTTIAPPPTPSSPRSPVLTNIGSSPVTAIISGDALQGPEKNSADAMQALQRQQTLPAAAAVLSPSRVTTSVADDLEDLLNETLLETGTMPAASSASPLTPIQPATVPSLVSAHIESVEQLLAEVASMGMVDIISSMMEIPADEIVRIGQDVNRTIGLINLNFKYLLERSENPGPWMEQESKTPFYRNYHPFAASCFLMTYLDQAACIHVHLKPKLIAEWKDNYQKCVVLLKRHGLDRYNETEFPFSGEYKLAIEQAKMMNGILAQNPQHRDAMKMAVKAFAENPNAMKEAMAQNPQMEEMMRKKMQEMGIDPAELEVLCNAQIQPLLSFFRELDQVLKRHSQDAGAVEAWLKTEASKPTYSTPFLLSHDLILRLSMSVDPEEGYPPDEQELKQLFNDCCLRLITLGLQRYVDEAPPPQKATAFRQDAIRHKADVQKALLGCLSVLRPLSAELKRLPVGAQARNSNREAIDRWFVDVKARGTDLSPFVASTEMYHYHAALEGVLDGAMLQELSVLYPFCRDQLVLLGLNKYLEELSPLGSPQMAKPAAAAASFAPKKALSETERFTRELAFFREMIKIDDKAVNQWLKDNSSKLDYPLLWAKKRMSQLSHFRDTVEMDLRREWRFCAETCLERVDNSTLRYHLEQIPADASPELKAFLA